ncbi:MAG: hypothetical protein OES57_05435, partial [Acidimicrobiia bacterium]|nr:hypothetical protein [Acidimicrobiia bacterium]
VTRTVHGRGYEFVAEISEVERRADTGGETVGRELPVAVSRLVGRDADLEHLRNAVAEHRLVTLVGPGGVGKTSLAYELCRAVDGTFADGIWPVELVSVTSAEDVPGAVATTLAIQAQQSRSSVDAIVEVFRTREAVLFFDNCEHVIDAISDLIDQLLVRAPDVTILTTSREGLSVAGEQLWPVLPLELGDNGDDNRDPERAAQAPAVRLFIERATAADPSFALDEDTVGPVIEICRQLDGVPLALELAAARVRSLDVSDLADRLSERFRLLRGTRRGADRRHHALLDTVKWSYDLLDDSERRLYEQLSVFAGPFDLAAAEAVCGSDDGDVDVIDGVARLVDRSMLSRRRTPAGTRHEMLETLRAYGAERLDDSDRIELHRRHLEHFLAEARRFGATIGTADESHAVADVDVAFADLRAAHRFALDVGDQDRALGLVAPLVEYAARTMRYELVTWAEQSLALREDDHPLRLLISGFCAYGMFVRGEYQAAVARAGALRKGADETDLGYALALRAELNADFSLNEAERALPRFAEHLRLAQSSGDAGRLAHSAYFNAVALASTGQPEEAARLAAVSAQAAAETGNPTAVACSLFALGAAAEHDDLDRAQILLERCEQTARSVGNRWMTAFAETEVASLHRRAGRLVEACATLAEVLDTWYRAGDWANQWLSLNHAVLALVDADERAWAAQVVGAIETHSTLGALPMQPAERALLLETAAMLPANERAVGATLAIDEVVIGTRRALLTAAQESLQKIIRNPSSPATSSE